MGREGRLCGRGQRKGAFPLLVEPPQQAQYDNSHLSGVSIDGESVLHFVLTDSWVLNSHAKNHP